MKKIIFALSCMAALFTPDSYIYAASGTATAFKVGGVLSISSGQATGSYTGRFNVDATYD